MIGCSGTVSRILKTSPYPRALRYRQLSLYGYMSTSIVPEAIWKTRSNSSSWTCPGFEKPGELLAFVLLTKIRSLLTETYYFYLFSDKKMILSSKTGTRDT